MSTQATESETRDELRERAKDVADRLLESSDYQWETLRSLPKEAVRAFVELAAIKPLRSVVEECVKITAATVAEVYPEDIFPPPPPRDHGRTVDGCTARGARLGANVAVERIRRYFGLPRGDQKEGT